MLGILRGKKSPVKEYLSIMGIDVANIKASLEEKIYRYNSEIKIIADEIYLDEKASNILRLAVLEARLQHTQIVDEQHLLLAIVHDNEENGVKEILENNDMTYSLSLIHI